MPIRSELSEKLQSIQKALQSSEKITRQRLEILGEETFKAFDSALKSISFKINVAEEIGKQKKQLRQWKIGFFHTLRPFTRLMRHFLSMPFIYFMIIPSVFLHISIEMYQQICFRLYGIPLVRTREYFHFDRALLPYLNWVEIIHCVYCSYVNHLFQFAVEIAGRTERYWCPIKYANHINKTHSQYEQFVEYFDGESFHEKWEKLRDFSDMENIVSDQDDSKHSE